MFKIISANLNGIRSATRKGFLDYLQSSLADVVCIQELKAQQADLTEQMLNPQGYHGTFHYAEKKGYSGVGIYSKKKPDQVQIGLGLPEFDLEGRFLRTDFNDSNLSVISLYLPSGSSSDERQQVKFAFLHVFFPMLQNLIKENRHIVICGDWNIAHQNIDIKNWKGNQKNSGFLPEERTWLTQVLSTQGWVDTWRTLYPEEPGYTWWSNRGQAYANNVGWRIDYQITSPNFAQKAVKASIYKEQKFSDHAPLIVEYSF